MRRRFIVSFEAPPGATRAEMAAYVKDAVESWRGQLYPGELAAYGEGKDDPDPLWLLNPETVKVTYGK